MSTYTEYSRKWNIPNKFGKVDKPMVSLLGLNWMSFMVDEYTYVVIVYSKVISDIYGMFKNIHSKKSIESVDLGSLEEMIKFCSYYGIEEKIVVEWWNIQFPPLKTNSEYCILL